ncbi:MAG: discoidin domain-containing protein [Prevotella sp.]|nr:discoidin domain-containing protein [Prevotella sp.]
MAIALVCSVTSCSDDDQTLPKVNIEESSVTIDSKQPGKVVFHWTIPENPDYYYIKVTYDDPVKGHRVLNASSHADSLMIDGLYAKYGDLEYSFTAVSRNGGEKPLFTKKAKAGYVPAVIKDFPIGTINLSASQLWTDNQETSEGPIANLVDGNNATYFHMSWSAPSPWPHYIRVDLGKKVKGVSIWYKGRNNANNDNPKQMTILASNEIGDTPEEAKAWEIVKLTSTVLPKGTAPEYTSPGLFSENEFQYLWLRVEASWSNKNWIALAELSIKEMSRSTYDPENTPNK